MTKKEKIISFAWQHLLLLIALYIMTLGVATCVKSMLGSSVISVLPYVFQDAGIHGMTPKLTIGQYTFIMNGVLVLGQLGVLRRQFDPLQLFQLLIGFVFGMLIDLNMYLVSWLQPTAVWEKPLPNLPDVPFWLQALHWKSDVAVSPCREKVFPLPSANRREWNFPKPR